jgi:hypothetical protein
MRFPSRAISCATAFGLALFAVLAATRAEAAQDLAGLLRDAKAAEVAGRLGDASTLYARAHGEWPKDLDAVRGVCEVGLEIAAGAPISATTGAACHQAFLATQGPRDLRNKVAALLAEKAKPDLDVIAISALMADAATKQAPDQPWGTLARLDIARHLRRADLLTTARSDLQPFAATNDTVRAALADDQIGRPKLWVWILRVLTLLGLAGTGVHALLRRNKLVGRKTTTSAVAATLLVLLSLLVSSRAVARVGDMPNTEDGQLSRFKIDDEHPEAAVQGVLATENDPLQLGYLLQDLSARVAAATAKHDNAAVARYYHAISLASPTAIAPRKECEALEAVGDIPGAILACRLALTRDGAVVGDYAKFIDVVLKNPQLPALEPQELENVIVHVEKEGKGGNLATVLRCKVALRFEDSGALERCSAAMRTAPFNDPTVISIKWGLAVRQHDKVAALALVEEARKAGFDWQNIQKMQQTTNAMSKQRLQSVTILGGLAILGVVAVVLGARLVAASRRRSASRSPA